MPSSRCSPYRLKRSKEGTGTGTEAARQAEAGEKALSMNEFRIVVAPFEAVQDINDMRCPQRFQDGERLVFLGLKDERARFRLRSTGSMYYLADVTAFNESTRLDPN